MHELITLVNGSGMVPAVIAVLEGRVDIGGNPFALLRLMPLLVSTPASAALPVPRTSA
jgi:pseudouridine-5'-phosphate glycosidase